MKIKRIRIIVFCLIACMSLSSVGTVMAEETAVELESSSAAESAVVEETTVEPESVIAADSDETEFQTEEVTGDSILPETDLTDAAFEDNDPEMELPAEDPEEADPEEEEMPSETIDDEPILPEEITNEINDPEENIDLTAPENEEPETKPEETVSEPVTEPVDMVISDTETTEEQENAVTCKHVSKAYKDVKATYFNAGQKGGTYCSVCGEELTKPEIVPMLELSGVLQKGMNGNEVYAVQKKLADLGYMIAPPDGGYGVYTEAAVNIFQAENGLYNPDGKVGNWTMSTLRNEPAFFSNLSIGMNSAGVKLLQTYLKQQGFLSASPDGIFGGMTYDAVCKFQLANGLSITGTADLLTFTFLLLGTGNSFRVMKNGDSGTDVKGLQNALIDAGFLKVEADGKYGALTTAAVTMFQAFNGLDYPDGKVGNWTCSKLFGSCNAFSTLELNDKGTAVFVMQRYLESLGYLTVTPNRVFGEETANALKEFQKNNGLSETGTGNYSTLLTLFTGNAKAKRAIQKGDSGNDVLRLQQKLYSLGYLTAEPDGYFGGRTYAAVCAFQAANGTSKPSGLADAHTLNLLASATKVFVPVTPSSRYSEICAIQYAMMEFRMVTGADGAFGSQTEKAVKQVQKVIGHAQTGVVDAETMYGIWNYRSFLDNRYSVQGYYSATNWLIFVNATTNRIYIYYGNQGNWTLQYNWGCDTGRDTDPTVLGQYTTNFRGYEFGDGYSCYYYTSFYGPYYMHSTLFSQHTFNKTDSRLGLNLSAGCVRMDIDNARWIYQNIPLGTKVVVTK